MYSNARVDCAIQALSLIISIDIKRFVICFMLSVEKLKVMIISFYPPPPRSECDTRYISMRYTIIFNLEFSFSYTCCLCLLLGGRDVFMPLPRDINANWNTKSLVQ